MTEIISNSTRIAKNTVFLYFRMLFLMVISLYTSRVFLASLGISDYGLYNAVGGFVAMFAIISAPLTSACTRFLNIEMGIGDADRLKVVFSTSVTIQLILVIVIALLCETIGLWFLNYKMEIPDGRYNAANWVFQLSILLFCLNLLTIPYNAAIVAHERMKVFAYLSIFDGLAKLVICFLIEHEPFDRLVYYAVLLFILQFIDILLYYLYCRTNFEECKYRFVLDKPLLYKMFDYSLWHLAGNSAAVLNTHGINILLNLFFGTMVNAAKGVANQVLTAVRGFANNFMMALNPQITQSYAKKDFDYMFNLVYKGSRFSFYLMLIPSLPIIINAEAILSIWLKEVPEHAVFFVQFSLIAALVSTLSNTLVTIQNATGNVRNFQLIVGGIQLMCFPICYLALSIGSAPESTMVIAVIIEVVALFARIFMIPIYIKEFNTIDFIKKVVLDCVYVGVVSTALPFVLYLLLPDDWVTFIVVFFVAILTSITAVIYVGCSISERKMIVKKIKSLLKGLARK